MLSCLLPAEWGPKCMGIPAIMQAWTVEMLDALPDDGQRYEIIDGDVSC